MKKCFLLFLIIFVFGADTLPAVCDDLWDNYGDQNVYGQKAVSDSDFEKALESKKKKKKHDKNIPKGENFNQSNETQFLNDTVEQFPILLVPMDLFYGENFIPVGHYQVKGEKKNGIPYLKLIQAHRIIAEIPAAETQDDFDEPEISFVRIIEHNNKQVKIIFGSIDFNAFSVVNIKE